MSKKKAPPKPAVKNTANTKSKNRLYLNEELDFDPLLPPKYKSPQDATDFVFVPEPLEKMIIFGMFVCFDSFLFIFTALPIRAFYALRTIVRREVLHPIQRVDLLKLMLIVVGYLSIRLFHMPSLTFFIKSESLMKLKIFFTLIELMERVLSHYGENILGALFWAVNQPRKKVKRGYLWHFILSIIYTVVHCIFLLFHISVLDVAINSKDYTLFTVLILVQFAEMKGAVLKSIDDKKLYDMCCDDIVERFQLVMLVILLFFENAARFRFGNEVSWEFFDMSWAQPVLIALALVYVSEVMVDWIKHTSIVNYMCHSPHIYSDFQRKFSEKLAPNASFLTDRSQSVFNKMGFIPIPLSVLFVRVLADWVPQISIYSAAFLTVGYLSLVGLRYLMGMIMKYWIADPLTAQRTGEVLTTEQLKQKEVEEKKDK